MNAISTTFYSDGGHGWLQVPKNILSELGIADKITSYSYMRGNYAYLEEDQDLSTFANALPNWEEWKAKVTERYDDDSIVRTYNRYRNQ